MIGKKVIKFEEIESTNKFIKMNHSNMEDGTVVVGESQNNGRGRSNHIWVSEVGNLYMSYLLKDGLTFKSIFNELMNVSVSITRLLKKHYLNPEIKYPNDILIKGKKIAGILIETKGGSSLEYIIVGIGLNINQVDFGELNVKATSLKSHKGFEFKIDIIMDELLIELNEKKDNLFDEYIANSMIINKEIDYDGKRYNVSGISKSGSLILSNGTEELLVGLNEISLEEIYRGDL